jgi:diguanylate cyclase (GGDEF)-like protein
MSALDLRLLGRLGGAGLLAGAVALFALSAVPHWETTGSGVTIGVCLATAAGGVLALRARWNEYSTRAGMVLTAGAYVALGVAGLTGGTQAAYGPLFVVVAAWCGLALGPTYTLKLAPLAVLCAALPSLLGQPGSPLTAIGAVAVATVTGEIFARLAERVRRDARRDAHRTSALEALTAGQLELARATDPAAAAAIASFVARQILDADRAAVLLERDGHRVELGACPPRELDAGEETSPLPEATPQHGAFEVPLSGRDGTGVRGVLAADPRPGARLDPFGQALAGSLAAATCAALESIALNGRLRVRAEVDPLTGLGNRRRLETAMTRLQPGDLVIVLDLDHFKAVNDTLGHDVGDEVLRAFGEHLTALTRAGELAIRTGGEEFVLVAQGGEDPRAGAALLGRLAADWWRTSPLTTFSAGAAVHAGGDPAVTMKRADEALYEAKRRGRAAGWLLDLHGGRLIPFPGTPFDARTAAHVLLPRHELDRVIEAPVGLSVHRA